MAGDSWGDSSTTTMPPTHPVAVAVAAAALAAVTAIPPYASQQDYVSGAERVAIAAPWQGQVLFIPGSGSKGQLLLAFTVAVQEDQPIRDTCGDGSIAVAVGNRVVHSEAVQLGHSSVTIADLAPGEHTLAIEWLAHPRTQSDGSIVAGGGREERELALLCARAAVSISVVAAELQLVQRPWGLVLGQPFLQQPWVSLVSLVPAGGDKGDALVGPGISDHRGAEISVRLRPVDGAESSGLELGSAVCGSRIPVTDEDEGMETLGANVAKFEGLQVPRAHGAGGTGGLHVLEFRVGVMCGQAASVEAGLTQAAGLSEWLSRARSRWRAGREDQEWCIPGSAVKSLVIDVAVFASEAGMMEAASVGRLRTVAHVLLKVCLLRAFDLSIRGLLSPVWSDCGHCVRAQLPVCLHAHS